MRRKSPGKRPPRAAEWVLDSLSVYSDDYLCLGDLAEEYETLALRRGKRHARLWYWQQVFVALPSYLNLVIYWRIAMFWNYWKTAVRHFRKQKAFSFINITGLAVALASCLLIVLWIHHELSYDRFHEKAGRICRIAIDLKIGDIEGLAAVCGAPTAAAMVRDHAEVVDAVRIMSGENWFVTSGDVSFKESRIAFADDSFFDIFTIPLVSGNAGSLIHRPNTLVISQSTAEKYFGSADPLGKTMVMDGRRSFQVTGVFEDIPENSHFHFDFIGALSTFENSRNTLWLSMNYQTYLLLEEGADYRSVESRMPALVKKYLDPELRRFMNMSYDEMIESGNKLDYILQPLTSIHLNSRSKDEFEPGGDIRYVYIFSAIAILILGIACVNYMNLATARSSQRAMEVGIRKTIGSGRRQLIRQFMSESVLQTCAAMLLAVVMARLCLPVFNSIAGKTLSLSSLATLPGLALLLGFTLLTGVIAGIYPAFCLSSFSALAVLKGAGGLRRSGRGFRNIMVVLQFTVSIFLIIGTLVIRNQLNFIQSANLGYEREHVLLIHGSYILRQNHAPFKNALLEDPRIVTATYTSYLPVTSVKSTNMVVPEGMNMNEAPLINTWRVAEDYTATFGMELAAGRDFSREFPSDSAGAVINESAMRLFGWDDAIGKRVQTYTSNNPPVLSTFHIIGVVKDFHFETMKERIGALMLVPGGGSDFMAVRLSGDDYKSVIENMRKKWQRFAPDRPFEYSFLDDRFNAMYQIETRAGRIVGSASVLAVFVGCLGLLGLAAFAAEARTKEIGVRKVMGASVIDVVVLLSREFFGLLLIAFALASVGAWLVMRRWLDDFSYRADLNTLPFMLAGLTALLLTQTVVGYQALKAAQTDPVKSLRYE